jgi:membrane-bound serine protease (ClpP class)
MILLSFLFAYISVAKLEGVIHPPAAEYVVRAIEEAEERDAECLILELDTPGGLDQAMRKITKAILNANVPVVVYVHPSGARCASAGVFILLSSHIAAMTPGTNIGAAHPVAMGKKMDEVMSAKVENDAVAYIRSIAKKRGRNEEWAEDAVRKSVSVTSEEALDLGVIDLLVNTTEELLEQIDGREVELETGTRVLDTKEATTESVKWRFKEKLFSKLANPTIAYILLMLGFWGIVIEFSHPGSVFPGVFGGISLILAFYALQLLPVNYAGVALILLGFVLFILEAVTPTFGPFSIGGVVSLVLGSLMLIRTKAPFLQISRASIAIVTILTASFFVFVLAMLFRTMRRKPTTGKRGFVGEIGEAKERIEPGKEGQVFVAGEWWKAIADETIDAGDKIEVVEVNRLLLTVRRKGKPEGESSVDTISKMKYQE